jgi:hypothetical protein
MLMLLWAVFFTVSGSYYIYQKSRVFADAPLPPSHLSVVSDDLHALATWDPSPDADTVGYMVTWGETGSSGSHTLFTADPDIQIQPLDQGKTYKVSVQSVNKNGHVSPVIGPVFAQSDATQTNRIKQQMNGMFDDFNTNTFNGMPDPTHWYTSINNATKDSMAFVSGMQHNLMMFLQNDLSQGERASLTMRSLRQFDFINRTGTIAFDFDFGQADRYQWALSVSPTLIDDINYDAIYNGSSAIYPLEAFQLYMEGNTIAFRKIVNGVIAGEWDSTYAHTHPLRDSNVRKHAQLKLSQNSAQLFVDGVQILSAQDINLSFSQGWLYNQQLVFNVLKAHIPYVLSHVDTIGFDAPVGFVAPISHTYTAGGYGNTDRKYIDFFTNTALYTITIPDTIASSTSERLLLDVHIKGQLIPKVTVNGKDIPWPVVAGLIDNGSYDTRVLTLPTGTLHQGDNSISITASDKNTFQIGIQNVHAELSFAPGTNTPYTPYAVPFSGNVIEAKIPAIAPLPGFGKNAPADGSVVSGTIPVDVTADGLYSLLSTGKVNPVNQVELDLDGAPQTLFTLPGPTIKTTQTLFLDTTKVSNGQHTLTVTAYGTEKNNHGTIAALNSFDTLLQNNPLDNAIALRRVIQVNNTGKPITPAPTIANVKIKNIPSLIPTTTSTPLLPHVASSSGQLGNDGVGNIHDVNEAHHINGIRVTTGDTAGTVSAMHVYVGAVDANPHNAYSMAIYADDNGKPGSLLAATNVGTLTSHAWNMLPIVTVLKPRTPYWLLYNTNAVSASNNAMTYTQVNNTIGVFGSQQFGNWPAQVTSFTLGKWNFSLYLTYAIASVN